MGRRVALSIAAGLAASSCTPASEQTIGYGFEVEMCGAHVTSSSLAPMQILSDRNEDDSVVFIYQGEPQFRGNLYCRLYTPATAFSREEIERAVEGVSRDGGLATIPQQGVNHPYALRLQPGFEIDTYLQTRQGASLCVGEPSASLPGTQYNSCWKQLDIGGGVFAEFRIYNQLYSDIDIENAIRDNLKAVKK